jgi:enoyl-[acyl-carrier protein] reductase I
VAYAPREDLMGRYLDTSREGFRVALDISAYSFTALARAAQPLMSAGSSLLTLTYYGGQKAVAQYNVMGVAKAALESSVRYLAADLGPEGIRVNAISAGPVRTLSAAGVSGFKKMYREFANIAPLRQEITPEDIGGAAVFLSSSMASKITGDVLFIDSGYNILGLATPEDPT